MRIAVDIQPLEGADRFRGIGRYSYNLIKSLVDKGQDDFFLLLGFAEKPPEPLTDVIKNRNCQYLPYEFPYKKEQYLQYAPGCSFALPVLRDIDILHIPSGLMPDVLIPYWAPCLLSLTLHDLIPIVMKKERGIDTLPKHLYEDYQTRIEIINGYNLFLTNSATTAKDAIKYLNIENDKVIPVGAGVEQAFLGHEGLPGAENSCQTGPNNQQLRKWGVQSGDYILSVGGYNPRKNMIAHFRTFREIVNLTRNNKLKLVVVCSLQETEKQEWVASLRQLGIEHQVVLTGYVTDDELKILYQNAALFLFLSVYEGFGFPVAEALASGIPVVASDIPSNREILGNYEYLVEPNDVCTAAKMAVELLAASSKDSGRGRAADLSTESSSLKASLRQKIKKFTWPSVADHCLQAYKQLLQKYGAVSSINIRHSSASSLPRLALFTPIRSIDSGVADYIRELLPYLSQDFSIDAFTNLASKKNSAQTRGSVEAEMDLAQQGSRIRPYSLFFGLNNKDSYDLVLYQMGNNIHHIYSYYMMRLYPGLVTLHDLSLAPFIFDLARNINPLELLWELEAVAPENSHQAMFNEFLSRGFLSHDLPLLRAVRQGARGLVVHNDWMKERLARLINKQIPIAKISMGIKIMPELSSSDREKERARLGIRQDDFVVISIGHISRFKRTDKALKAFAWFNQLHSGSFYIIAGNIADKHWENYLKDICKSFNIARNVIFTGFTDFGELIRLLAIADVGINLRFPSFGETSASLLRALAAGLACLVTDVGQYQEFPDHCCLKVPPDANEIDYILEYLLMLKRNEVLRKKIGQLAREFVSKHHAIEAAAYGYIQLVKDMINQS